MLVMLLISSSSRIFDLRAFSFGVRFFTGILLPSTVISLFYTFAEVYTKFGMASANPETLGFIRFT